MSFETIRPQDINENVFDLIGNQWMLVTAGDSNGYNTMTASWGGMGVMWGKNVAVTVIRPQRYTMEFIKKNGLFTLSFYDEQYKPALGVCGSKSGRDIDKAKETGLTPVFGEGTTYFEQAKLVLVCRKLYERPMDPSCLLDQEVDEKWYPGKDYHRMFVGEVVKVLRKEQ
nr:flavin reductase [uncultured Solibaculum sp.]